MCDLHLRSLYSVCRVTAVATLNKKAPENGDDPDAFFIHIQDQENGLRAGK